MARMKFLCDADRCIECNACVTACKNEHEVPWGINRRRVVTINDGKPGERSVSMACMHCTDAPCAAVCPVRASTRPLTASCCIPRTCASVADIVSTPARSARRNIRRSATSARAARWTSAPIAPAGRRRRVHGGRIRQIRRQPSRRRQAADVRRDVLDQIAAGGRRRDHRRDLQGARDEARLRVGRMGLDDRLPRGHRGLNAALQRPPMSRHANRRENDHERYC